MAQGKMIAVTLIAMTLVAVFLTPLAAITTENTGTVSYNETVTVHTDEWTDLNGYEIDASTFNAETTGGTALTEGTDYELNETAGTIKALSGSVEISDGDSVYTEYDYQATDQTTTTIAGLIPTFAALLILGTAAMKIRQIM